MTGTKKGRYNTEIERHTRRQINKKYTVVNKLILYISKDLSMIFRCFILIEYLFVDAGTS